MEESSSQTEHELALFSDNGERRPGCYAVFARRLKPEPVGVKGDGALSRSHRYGGPEPVEVPDTRADTIEDSIRHLLLWEFRQWDAFILNRRTLHSRLAYQMEWFDIRVQYIPDTSGSV